MIDKQKDREDIMNLYGIFATEPFENLKMELKRKILQKFGFESLEDALDQDIEELTQQMIAQQEQQTQMAEEEQMMAQQQAEEQAIAQEQNMMSEAENADIAHQRELEKIAVSKGMM